MERIELTKEKVILASMEQTIELLEPFMLDIDEKITQQRIDEFMNLLTARPDMMQHAKRVAMHHFWDKFQITATWGRDGSLKRLM